MAFILTLKKQTWLLDVCFLFIVFCSLYYFGITQYPLFTPDEGRYSEIAREMITTQDYITPRLNGIVFLDKPILHYWLQTLAMRWFGFQETAVRFFPILLAILSCIYTYVAGRLLYNRAIGLLAAGILASAPLWFGSAHYANLDAEAAIFISATLFSLLIGLHIKQSYYFILAAYLLAALAFLTKGLIGIAFPLAITGIWCIVSNQLFAAKKLYSPIGILLFFIIVLPWTILVQKENPHFFYFFFIKQQFGRYLAWDDFNNKSPVWFYLPIILLGFFPWSIFAFHATTLFIKKIRMKHEYTIELFLVVWIITILAFFSVPHSKIITYILPLFPAMALLMSYYLLSYSKNIPWLSTNCYLLLISVCFIGFLYYFSLKFKQGLLITHHIKSITVILCISLIFACILSYYRLFIFYVMNLMISNFVLLLILINGASYINHESIKPIIIKYAAMFKNDDIYTYHKYYYDLPFYLNKKIFIVANWHNSKIEKKDNWMREFWYGLSIKQNNVMNENQFWEKWHQKKKIYLFLSPNALDQFKAHTNHYFVIEQNEHVLLISNSA